MIIIAACSLSLIFVVLSGVHVYWGVGGKWAIDSAAPSDLHNRRVLRTSASACFVVASGLLLFATLPLMRLGLLANYLPEILAKFSIWIIPVVFTLRAIGDFTYVGFFKKIRSTAFAKRDYRYYSPLCLLISALALVIIMNT